MPDGSFLPWSSLTENVIYYKPDSARSSPGQRPIATSDLSDSDLQDQFMLISGGFCIEPGKPQLAIASYPEFGESWVSRSKDHGPVVSAWIESWAIGVKIRPTKRVVTGAGIVQEPIGIFRRTIATAETSTPSQTPEAKAILGKQYALTGCGADARTPEPGALLWKLAPGPGDLEAVAGSKDHQLPAEGAVKTWAIGIGLDELDSEP